MRRVEQLLRFSIGVLAVVVLAASAASTAWAKDSAKAAGVPVLPTPLTKEAVRELVSRLSDDDVRKLLLDQLDRTAAAESAQAKASNRMSGMVGEHAGTMRPVFEGIEEAARTLPDTLRNVGTKLTEPDGSAQYLVIVELLAALLVSGWIIEWFYRRALRDYRTRLGQTVATTFTARAFHLGVGLLLDFGGIVVWSIAAITAFFLLWHDHAYRRTTILDLVIVVVIVRVTALLARFLLAPRAPSERLLPFADAPARTLFRFAVTFATLVAVWFALDSILLGGGASPATGSLLTIAVLALGVPLTIGTVWRVRTPIANLIRGDGKHGAIVGWLADLWPVIATAYLIGVLVGRVFDVLAEAPDSNYAGIASVLLVVAIPIVDMALCRALAAAAAGELTSAGSHVRGFVADYEPVFRRAIHIVVVVIGMVVFAHVWGIDVFELAQRSMGGRISSSLLGICIVLLLAYMIWEGVKTAIDRRLAAEGELDLETPASRLRTLLPILRLLILTTIVVMATMSVLAALGVDILPLLAGASVVGVAIGFGSQTLVRDIVSGAFFLMDDAFRLGEYIEVGSDKGRVEKINVRSLFLRHHRGAINILPYGEIKRLRNTSRDWIVMVMDFRLTYDTSLAQVKKIIKQIGEEIAADPELAPSLLQPLKFGGVLATEDSAIVVRAKFTARPEGEPYMIQKAAYTKIIKAFRDAGIQFAHKQVTVNVPPGYENDEAMVAAAGAAALAAITPERK